MALISLKPHLARQAVSSPCSWLGSAAICQSSPRQSAERSTAPSQRPGHFAFPSRIYGKVSKCFVTGRWHVPGPLLSHSHVQGCSSHPSSRSHRCHRQPQPGFVSRGCSCIPRMIPLCTHTIPAWPGPAPGPSPISVSPAPWS